MSAAECFHYTRDGKPEATLMAVSDFNRRALHAVALSTCHYCGCEVRKDQIDRHAEWHAEQDELLAQLSKVVHLMAQAVAK